MVTKPLATRLSRQDDGPGDAETDTAGDGPIEPVAEAKPSPVKPRGRLSAWRDRGRMTLRVIRSNPTGRIALKVGVAITGAIVVALGLVLIPLPGPGWALVILGLAIWGIEFVWAKHLMRFTRTQVQRWTRWVTRQTWPVRILLGLVGLVFVTTVVALSLKYSFGIDVVSTAWTYVTTH